MRGDPGEGGAIRRWSIEPHHGLRGVGRIDHHMTKDTGREIEERTERIGRINRHRGGEQIHPKHTIKSGDVGDEQIDVFPNQCGSLPGRDTQARYFQNRNGE